MEDDMALTPKQAQERMSNAYALVQLAAAASNQDPQQMCVALGTGGVEEGPLAVLPIDGVPAMREALGDTCPGPMIFACVLIETKPTPTKSGMLREQCDACGKSVWMSPETRETYEKTPQKCVLCSPCIDLVLTEVIDCPPARKPREDVSRN
jgi:hypothetical protein